MEIENLPQTVLSLLLNLEAEVYFFKKSLDSGWDKNSCRDKRKHLLVYKMEESYTGPLQVEPQIYF